MKKIVIALASLISLSSCAPQPVTVSGSVAGAGEGTEIVLISEAGKRELTGNGDVQILQKAPVTQEVMKKGLTQWFVTTGSYERSKATADSSGNFKCPPVELSGYNQQENLYLAAHAKLGNEHDFWIIPVELKSGQSASVKLDDSNVWIKSTSTDDPVANYSDTADREALPTPKPAFTAEQIGKLASESTGHVRYQKTGGSGFFIGRGLLVTNNHVIDHDEPIENCRILVEPQGKTKQIYKPTRIITADPILDLALLEVHDTKQSGEDVGVAEVPPLELASRRDDPRQGQSVYAYGSPEGFTGTLSTGIIAGFRDRTSSFSVPADKCDLIQLTAPISHGSSGGPLLNDRGQVVGITTAKLGGDAQNINFAVPVKYLRALLQSQKH